MGLLSSSLLICSPDMSSDWAPEFQDLIKRMLAKDPTERINMESIRVSMPVAAYFVSCDG